MVALPAALPVTTPEDDTVAVDSSELLHTTESVELLGVLVAVRVVVLSFATVVVPLMLIPVVGT